MLKSVNQIYHANVKDDNIQFSDWLKTEQYLYRKRGCKSSFKLWLNRKYTLCGENFLNFDWEKASTFVKQNKGEIAAVVGGMEEALRKGKKAEDVVENEVDDDTPPKKDKLLGLPPVVTYGVGILLLFGVGFGIYKIVKRKK